jgi:hypothetical protein
MLHSVNIQFPSTIKFDIYELVVNFYEIQAAYSTGLLAQDVNKHYRL